MGHRLPRLKAAFEDGTLSSLPKDAFVRDDLRAIVVERGIPKLGERSRTKTPDGGQRHGDAAIALVLAWFATTQDGGCIEYTEVPRHDRDAGRRDWMRADEADLPAYAGRGDW